MGIFRFFRRIMNFCWGLLFVLMGMLGGIKLAEDDPGWKVAPACYILWAIQAVIVIYGLRYIIKAFRKSGVEPIDDEEKSKKKQKTDKPKKQKTNIATMEYIGKGRSDYQGLIVEVPTNHQTGYPDPDDLKEALRNLGLDKSTVSALYNGMSTADWRVVSNTSMH